MCHSWWGLDDIPYSDGYLLRSFEIICLLDGYSAEVRSVEYCFSFHVLSVRQLGRIFRMKHVMMGCVLACSCLTWPSFICSDSFSTWYTSVLLRGIYSRWYGYHLSLPPVKKKKKKRKIKKISISVFPKYWLQLHCPRTSRSLSIITGLSLSLFLVLFSVKAGGCAYYWWCEFRHPQKRFVFLSLVLCRECLFLFVKDTWSWYFFKNPFLHLWVTLYMPMTMKI